MQEQIQLFFKDFFIMIAALIPIINPMGQMPIFLSLTEDLLPQHRAVLAKKIAFNSFILLLASLMIGTYVLKFFGISLQAVQIGGGLLVATTGWRLLLKEDSMKMAHSSDSVEGIEAVTAAYQNRAFFPLTFPNTVGPGSISVAITLGANLQSDKRFEIGLILGVVLAIVLVSAVIFLCYRFADRLIGLLGEVGTSVFLRFSAFILLCLGVQILWNGISTWLQSLAI